MSISLEKGGRINLSKEFPSLTKIRAGLGWDVNGFDTGTDFDLDVSLFLCGYDSNRQPKLLADNFFVFYGNTKSPDGAVVHSGDNKTGSGAGDDETVTLEFSKMDPRVEEISVVVTIHKAAERRQNFGQVSNSYIKLYDETTGAELANYALEEDFSAETAVQVGSFYRKDGGWSFKAVGAGFKRGLADFVRAYGAEVSKE